jgi:hypothetical protein
MVGKAGNYPISPCSAPSIHSRLAASADWRSTKISPLYLSSDLSLCLRNKTQPDLLTQEKKSGYKKQEEKVRLSLYVTLYTCHCALQRCEIFPTKFLRSQFLTMCVFVTINFYLQTRIKLKLKLLICFGMIHHTFKHVIYCGYFELHLQVSLMF